MRQTQPVRGRLRGIFGDQLARQPVARTGPVPLHVEHRVFVRGDPERVWAVLLTAPADLDLETGCVRVLRLPVGPAAPGPPQLVSLWRRRGGRLAAGLSEVVDVQPGVAVLSRSADSLHRMTLRTTTEPLDDGCVVTQRLEGPVASFAEDRAGRRGALWLERGLLQLKAHVEGVSLPAADLQHSISGLQELESPPVPGAQPVSATVSVVVAVPAERLWQFLDASLSEPLVTTGVAHVVRTALLDDPRDHAVSVHLRDDGSRQVHVTQLLEVTAPSRIVERSLTADLETDVVTSIDPHGDGCVLTETFTGWLPPGAGATSGSGPVESLMRSRLETIRRLVEAGVSPQRDPRTGFLPPGSSPPNEQEPQHAPTPPALLLPPPHLVTPAPQFDRPSLPLGWFEPFTVLPLPGDVDL